MLIALLRRLHSWQKDDSVHRRLAEIVLRTLDMRGAKPSTAHEFLQRARRGDDPFLMLIYTYAAFAAWFILATLAGFLMIALAIVGHGLAGDSGRTLGATVGIGMAFYCVGGAADAAWRSLLVYFPGQRSRKGQDVTPRRNLWLLARPRKSSLVLQVAAGVVAGLVFATR